MNPIATVREFRATVKAAVARARARTHAATLGRPGVLGAVLRVLVAVLAFVLGHSWMLVQATFAWAGRHLPLSVFGLVLASLLWFGLEVSGWPGSAVTGPVIVWALFWSPGLVLGLWAAVAPGAYRRSRLRAWYVRRWLTGTPARWGRKGSEAVGTASGLGVRQPDGGVLVPGIKVRFSPGAAVLRLNVVVGQTVDDIVRAASRIATAYGAHGHELRPVKPGVVDLVLFHVARLAARTAVMPAEFSGAASVGVIPAGVRRDGQSLDLIVRGRHTLVVGATGAGKGSVLWSVAGNLAPAVYAGYVRLWGVDLKQGIEVETGRALFGQVAYKAADAVAVLETLVQIMNERGDLMRGISRNHTPTPDAPLHVLVVDELADLMAYSEFKHKNEAERLLSKLLTQGRALGVVVLGCVQNPRQEALGGTRGLWPQKIALRLDSEVETDMVLGTAAPLAPAHDIPADIQPGGISGTAGTAYLVTEDGTPTLCRFDYWPDRLIHAVANRYPAPAYTDTPAPAPVADAASAWLAAGGHLPALEDAPANPGPDDDGPANDNPANDAAPSERPKRKRSARKSTRNRRPADATAQAVDTGTTEQETSS
ncbi:FtsK/SpoIIIE domain-containing protein [Myceligenerans xiligouense]|uniref:FtsK/SpoIIIE family protein n=1 Tax=Myceligenerans xiligouense TaxID=253184 RepID=A0A3N4Z7J8_9MICO|nr:FtsK/SpoIIIE domain-containing protein [Myceligenerans xiligouense]RPF21292.1 FtsK/SpoIIIE family protein [Myceligenerans xiligouense]